MEDHDCACSERRRTRTPRHDDAPTFEALAQLATSADVRDRAFAASVLSLRGHAEDGERAESLYARIRETALRDHAEMRERIRARTFDRGALEARFREAAGASRDHLVEEILDIAYPPLGESSLPEGAIRYCPSGLGEILFTLEKANLGPGKTFVDLGSGLGKVVLLVALLTGARACGVELDPRLVAHARAAARSLRLDDACFIEGDIRAAPLPAADVYYMYIPVIQSTAVVARLAAIAAARKILVFSPALDRRKLPWLRASQAASYWLEMYEGPEMPG